MLRDENNPKVAASFSLFQVSELLQFSQQYYVSQNGPLNGTVASEGMAWHRTTVVVSQP
jgi:hypothetical protein